MNYEKVWREPVYHEGGNRIKFSGGYVHKPVGVENDMVFSDFLTEVKKHLITEFDIRMAKATSNWISGPILAYKDKMGISDDVSPSTFIEAKKLRDLIVYVEFTDLLDFSTAKSMVLPELFNNFSKETTWDIMERLGVIDNIDNDEASMIIQEVLDSNPDEVKRYKEGKKALIGFFIGEVMKVAKGKINGKEVKELVINKLND